MRLTQEAWEATEMSIRKRAWFVRSLMKTVWLPCAAMVLALTTPSSAEGESSCALMQRLAQQHSNDMARRNSLDHAGFHSRAFSMATDYSGWLDGA